MIKIDEVDIPAKKSLLQEMKAAIFTMEVGKSYRIEVPPGIRKMTLIDYVYNLQTRRRMKLKTQKCGTEPFFYVTRVK